MGKGVNVNQQDGTGRSALHLASWFGHLQLVQILLDYKAEINLQENEGHTPLHLACWFGYIKICELLVKKNASLDALDHFGRTPLHFAVQHNRIDVVEFLLKSGATFDIKDCNGKTPEDLAVTGGKVEIVDIFQRLSKPMNIIEEQFDEASEERKIFDEHQKMKSLVMKLIECRNIQVEHFRVIKDKIENQELAQKRLQSEQIEIQKHIESLQKSLGVILEVLNTITPADYLDVEIRKPKPENTTNNYYSTVASNRMKTQPRIIICRKCNLNIAKLRCKHCKSPLCQACSEIIKQNGCPFCFENSHNNNN